MRVVDSNPTPKGSLKWIQQAVNQHPTYTSQAVAEACGLSADIHWVSPLESDEFAEYRDADFLARLSLTLPDRSLESFWPRRGPQWDALATTSHDEILLVEAKANLPEVK